MDQIFFEFGRYIGIIHICIIFKFRAVAYDFVGIQQ